MSSWGVTEIGSDLPISAWEYRTRYLSDGVQFDKFFCPFCGVRLSPVLIYAEGELSKSPHFRANREPHRFSCDGEAEVATEPGSLTAKRHFKPREMRLPEALICRPQNRIVIRQPEPKSPIPTSPDDLEVRKKKIRALGQPTPSTYLLQPIVEAYSIILREIYSQAKSSNWDDAKRNAEIKSALSSLPIKLEDHTNYHQAMCTTKYLNWKYPRIYRGTGNAINSESGLIIRSNTMSKVQSAELPFVLSIDQSKISEKSPKSQIELLNQIKESAFKSEEFGWYAYGMPVHTRDAIVLNVSNLDYLFIKRKRQKQT